MAFCSPGALVHQAEEHGHILNVVGGELLQHLLIPYPVAKCNHYRSIGDTMNGIANLREPLDEGAQGFPWPLLDGMKIGLVTWPSIGALEVGREMVAPLWPGVEGPLGEIHEPEPGRPRQGYMEVVGHDSLIPPSHEDGGGVDLQELSGVDHPVVLLWQVGPELGWPDHHTQVRGQCHAPPSPPKLPGSQGGEAHVQLGAHPLVHAGKVSLEVATLDVSMLLVVAVDGGATVLPTSTVVDLLPEVHHLVAGHQRAVLHQRVRTWHPRGRLSHGWRTCC
jgi:hypothetical protein